MSKQEPTLLLKIIEEVKVAEKALLVKKDNKLYKNLKKFINAKGKIAEMDKEKE